MVLAELGAIDYWFVAENRRVHKTVHHFLLEATGGELSDEDVEVTEVAWVALGELDELLAYADERRLVRRAIRLLADADPPARPARTTKRSRREKARGRVIRGGVRDVVRPARCRRESLLADQPSPRSRSRPSRPGCGWT